MASRIAEKKVFCGTFIHSTSKQDLEILHNAAVAVDEAGKIVAVSKGWESIKDAQQAVLAQAGWKQEDTTIVLAAKGQFFFPGFIDTHIHASQYPNAGIFGKTTLLDWLEKYTFPMESSLKDLARARQVYTAVICRTLSHGTTTAAYYATIDVGATNLLADLCLSLGQRAFVGRVCMDRPGFNPDYYRDESPQAAIEATLATIEHISSIDPKHEIVAPILTPRFAPSCTEAVMKELSKVQKSHNLLVQTHISENTNEVHLVSSLFPGTESYAHVYDQAGLLTSKMVLAHAVHLTDEEAKLIALRKSKIAHCPCSNSSLTSGAARVRWMWDKGIDVGLGTDVSGGYSPSILEASRQALLVSRQVALDQQGEEHDRSKLTVEEALYLATRGGAQCLGLEDKIGGFDIGMDWDAQLIGLGVVSDSGLRVGEKEEEEVGQNGNGNSHDIDNIIINGSDQGNVDIFGWETWEDILAKWVYCGDDRNTKQVWVKGRLVHSRG